MIFLGASCSLVLYRFDEVLHREAYLYSRPQTTQHAGYRSEPGYEEAYSPTRTQTQVWMVLSVVAAVQYG